MTEEQAQAHLCCGPHYHSPNVHHNCQGQRCMAWRWSTDHNEAGAVTQQSSTDGYCGLAGAE